MALEIFQIIILLVVGALVGISISFIGQTGQGIVLPIILLFTGDVFLAIAINLLNDVITSASVSIGYLRKRELKIRIDILIIIFIAVFFSLMGIIIVMTTALGAIFGWFIPLFVMILGLMFLKRGFPSHESVKRMIQNISRKARKKENSINSKAELDIEIDESLSDKTDLIQGFIKPGSRLFYVLAITFGVLIGLNSGLFGASSGFIFVLVLVILYGYPLKKGVGTALILSIVIGFSAFIFYQIFGILIKGRLFINFELSFYLAIGSIVSGILTSAYVQKLSAKIMGRAVGIVIFTLGSLSLSFYFIF